MSANALQALLAFFKNRQQAMNPVWGDIEQRAYRRGYESALEKCIEDVVMQAESAPPERKIVQITDVEGWLIALCNDGTVWKLYAENEWASLPPIPQGQSS